MNLNQSLFDIIGILIGFISIILLLSLVVTSMVQSLQASLRLRGRNLKHGLQALIESVLEKAPKEADALALKVLNASNIRIIGKKTDPTLFRYRLAGPAISYIDPEDLPKAFKEVGAELTGDVEKFFLCDFNKMWNQLEHRFLFRIRLLTVGCALAVAVYFQISTPALLSRLSMDKAWRDHIVADTASYTGTVSAAAIGKDDQADKALMMLAVDKAMKRYEVLLDQHYAKRRDGVNTEMEAAMGKLSKFDISGWPLGWEFYYKSGSVEWANLVGVLITVILLSFGAPFWFERLKEVLKLKDTLSKGIKPEEENGGKKKPQRRQTGG